jgi:hypothetical protein
VKNKPDKIAMLLGVLSVFLFTQEVRAAEIVSQTNFTSLQLVVTKIFGVLMLFLPAVATLYLALSGYRYIIAQGNPDLVEKAKKSLTYAVLGVIVAYSSVLIINLFARPLGFTTGFIL